MSTLTNLITKNFHRYFNLNINTSVQVISRMLVLKGLTSCLYLSLYWFKPLMILILLTLHPHIPTIKFLKKSDHIYNRLEIAQQSTQTYSVLLIEQIYKNCKATDGCGSCGNPWKGISSWIYLQCNLIRVPKAKPIQISSYFNHIFDTAMGVTLNHRLNPNQRFHLENTQVNWSL